MNRTEYIQRLEALKHDHTLWEKRGDDQWHAVVGELGIAVIRFSDTDCRWLVVHDHYVMEGAAARAETPVLARQAACDYAAQWVRAHIEPLVDA